MDNFQGGRFTGGGHMGTGRMVSQIIDKDMIHVAMTPLLRKKIREEYGCTDKEADVAVAAGITDFGDEFKKHIEEQRALLVPPKEIDDE